jgi:hypothetical protein
MSTDAAFAQGSSAQREAAQTWPKHPLWLAYLLAPLGVRGAQAVAGFHALGRDPCRGFNWLLSAAQQHQLFAEWHIRAYYYSDNEQSYKVENAEKEFLWHLHWLTHFPDDKDDSHMVAATGLKLSLEQENAVRERFKTWAPADERPLEPASCPSARSAQR